MTIFENLIAKNLAVWTSSIKKKSNLRKDSSSNIAFYGIRKLRELILELAIRGMLVKQENCDEDASEIINKIELERLKLLKDGKLKKQKMLPEIKEIDQPFSLPHNWKWIRLGNATNYGITDKIEAKEAEQDTWVLELEDIEKSTSKLLKKVRFNERPFKSTKNRFNTKDVIYGKLRPYLDKVLIADEPGVCTTEMIPIRAYAGIYPGFLRWIMKSSYFIRYANNSTHGMNLPRMGADKARLALIPLAPQKEQYRIAAKVDELMMLCDQLEQEQESNFETHHTFITSLLNALSSSATNAKKFAESWYLIQKNFDILFTTESSIDQLKQTIIHLSMMGKIVLQDSTEEPAAELLLRIAKEKLLLEKEGKIKKQKNKSLVEKEDEPFSLPSGWDWTRLGNIARRIHYGYTAKANFEISKVRLLRITDIHDDNVDWNSVPGCEITEKELAKYKLNPGDILIARSGSVGKSLWVRNIDVDAVFASYLIRVETCEDVYVPYLKLFLRSPLYWQQLISGAKGVAQTNVNGQTLSAMILPFPPIAEQYRIVEKVNELISICDQLKSSLFAAQTTQLNLADSLVERAIS